MKYLLAPFVIVGAFIAFALSVVLIIPVFCIGSFVSWLIKPE